MRELVERRVVADSRWPPLSSPVMLRLDRSIHMRFDVGVLFMDSPAEPAKDEVY
jgi:hypothetical protein